MATEQTPGWPKPDASSFAQVALMTAEEFLVSSSDFGRAELIDGRIEPMSPEGYGHGRVVARLSRILDAYVEQHGLGAVCGGDVGFVISRSPDTVRAPDVSFISTSRLPPADSMKYVDGPPDLAIEVVSPSDRKAVVRAKAETWIGAGIRMAWIVDPTAKNVAIHQAGEPVKALGETELLEADHVLPGFSCVVSRLFAV